MEKNSQGPKNKKMGAKQGKENKVATSRTKYGIFHYWPSDVTIAASFKKGKVFEQELIERYLLRIIKGSKVVIDVGAHIGSHSITYTALNPKIRVLSFEIQPPIFQLLTQNIMLNRLEDKIQAFPFAVGPYKGKARISSTIDDGEPTGFSYDSNKPTNFGGVSLGNTGNEVDMISLDDLKLDHCDFIKIDVEGFEPFVIEGAVKTITRFHPIILYENLKPITEEMLSYFNRTKMNQPLPVETQLKKLGYQHFRLVPGYNVLAS
jgi:FkbM family methyltransferase